MIRSRINDLNDLKLPHAWNFKISSIIKNNIMLYEPWLETATSYNELRKKLIEKGYSNIPVEISPMINFDSYENIPIANTSSCNIVKTMLRKKH